MQRIGRYEILGELGRGAMGIVYRAQDPVIGRTVAIKTIRLQEFTEPEEMDRLRERLFREARSAGILSHPNIVTIYDIGQEGTVAYIAMEFVSGSTLDGLLRRQGTLPPDRIISILRETASALDYAHSKGIIHRDIKPANIMTTDAGSVKIADFGVAKITSQQMTRSEILLGTPSYMAPEQIEGKPLDGRADQFAMAVIVYELVTGEKPFLSDSVASLLFKIVHEEPNPAHRLNPSVNQAVSDALGKALAKGSAGRYPTCTEFVNALEAAFRTCPNWKSQQRGAANSLPTVFTKPGTVDSTQDSVETVAVPPVRRAASPPPPPPQIVTVPPVQPPVQTVQPPVPPPAPPPASQTTATPGKTHFSRRAQPDESGATPIPPPVPDAPAPSHTGRNIALGLLGVALIAGAFFGGRAYLQQQQSDQPAVTQTPPPTADPKPPVSNRPSPIGEPAPAPPPPDNSGTQTPAPIQTQTPPPRTPAPNTPAAAPVTVQLTSTPSGALAIVDQAVNGCQTPCSAELPPGRHVVRFTLEGHRPTVAMFNTPDETSATVRLDRITGTLAVKTTPPGAEIVLNGKTYGRSPALIQLPAGKYKLELRQPGMKEIEQDIEIGENATKTVEVSWQ